MPTYEYECQKCQHRFDLFQSIKAEPLKTCPKCKKGRVKRLFSTGGGLLFKGSGFYITDYRKPGYTEAAKKDVAAPAPAATPTTTTTTTTTSTATAKTPAKKTASKD